jgi:hypothetical protein
MTLRYTRLTALLATAAAPILFLACGGGGSSTTSPVVPTPPAPTTGMLAMSVSDGAAEDWATIGVKILSISLTPQGGGAAVPVYTAPATVPVTNLVQLDNLSELLGTAAVPAGVYTGATLTVAANPGDVSLVVAANPETGFAGTPGATIAPAQIEIQRTQGTAGSLTVPVNVAFASPITVTAGQTSPLDLEFDLSHPAFIVDHTPADGSAPFWGVSFNGPMVRHNPIHDITRMVLRHLYGTVTTVAADASSITLTKDHAVYPPTSPETAIPTTQSLTILADATNKTLFYDVDAKTQAAISDFSSVASSLAGKYVRVAARYQDNGTLVAVRVWASSSFPKVWISPEGHVLHTSVANPALPVITVANEAGASVDLTVDANTKFFYRTPAKALADATPIATGPAFITSGNLVRGFKVHASVVDPLATPLVAQTVDIEIAKYDGVISKPSTTGFTYTRAFRTATDNYTANLSYISAATPNGKDATGAAILGFKWWNFSFPTLADTGAGAIPDFVSATGGAANFFTDPTKAVDAWGVSGCEWGDPSASTGWAARWTVLEPVTLPLGAVGTAWVPATGGGSFGMVVPKGQNTVKVALSSVSGSAALVYQVDRTGGVVSVSPQDITTTGGMANLVQNLGAVGTKVKVFGIPQANGSVTAYVLFYYTGTVPAQ